jgi:hypothetical protein
MKITEEQLSMMVGIARNLSDNGYETKYCFEAAIKSVFESLPEPINENPNREKLYKTGQYAIVQDNFIVRQSVIKDIMPTQKIAVDSAENWNKRRDLGAPPFRVAELYFIPLPEPKTQDDPQDVLPVNPVHDEPANLEEFATSMKVGRMQIGKPMIIRPGEYRIRNEDDTRP